ncbi:Proteasome maturation protein, putative [Perkinsus marinus ATCC 50983]|uniref:Proteasome maturation protein, putative n=1 Tax=Perkinsus marinus (strain ATCC 50983 / TXsc) TaxID=423536 RepID=C5L202_PERM5|nr:Proteasome maturation protein, putative [Perkinsus marinus ATCC 50983]EER09271.1 Proteasome maturation protein, putative [Perkinsus marinus ATCC 50983]|eukprot:XP_002777455.1 Proteasome maturation protein, putative [Perkinsus marinus ATCC 50983]
MDMSNNSLPPLSNDCFPNQLMHGERPAPESVGMSHPVEAMQKKSLVSAEARTMETASVMFGMNMPSRMLMERNLLSTFHRLPGAGPSSLLGLETVMGMDDTIEAADYMNLPESSPFPRSRKPVHDQMEQKLDM